MSENGIEVAHDAVVIEDVAPLPEENPMVYGTPLPFILFSIS